MKILSLLLLLFAPSFSKKEVKNYILTLRNPSLNQRRSILLELHSRLKEMRLRAGWRDKKDGQLAEDGLKQLRNDKVFFSTLVSCLRYKMLRPIALRCLSKLGGDSSAKILYLLGKRKTNKRVLTYLLNMGEEAQPYLLSLLRLGKAKKFEEKILLKVGKKPSAKAVAYLVELLKKPPINLSPQLLQKAFFACGNRGVEPLKKLALTSGVAGLKALLILGRGGTLEAVDFLKGQFPLAKTFIRKVILLRALGESRKKTGEVFLLNLAGQKNFPLLLAPMVLFSLGFGKTTEGENFLIETALGKNSLAKNPQLAIFALQALAHRKSKKALPLFLKALDSKDPKKIEKGLFGLTRLGEKSVRKKLETLYLSSFRGKNKYQALYVLSQIAQSSSVDWWLQIYSSKLDIPSKKLILFVLKKFPSPKVDHLMESFLGQKEEILRYRAKRYFQKTNTAKLKAGLIKNLGHPNSTIALESALALAKLGTGHLNPKGAKALTRLLFDHRQNKKLIELVGDFSVKESAVLLKSIGQNQNFSLSLRQSALFSLAKIGGKEALETLTSWIVGHKTLSPLALEALGLMRSPKSLEILLESLKNSTRRKAALRGLSQRKEPATIHIFLQILLNPKAPQEEQKMAGKFFLAMGKTVKKQAYLLIEGPPMAQYVAGRILSAWGEEEDLNKLSKLRAENPKKFAPLVNFLTVYQKGREFRNNQPTVLAFLKKIKNGDSQVFYSSCLPFVFDLNRRKYYELRGRVEPLRRYFSTLDLKEVYLLDLKTFLQYTHLFAKGLPSEILGDAVVIFQHRSSKILVLKKGPKGWKVWGGA